MVQLYLPSKSTPLRPGDGVLVPRVLPVDRVAEGVARDEDSWSSQSS